MKPEAMKSTRAPLMREYPSLRGVVSLSKDRPEQDWYLIITAANGICEADGWIRGSAEWSLAQARRHAFATREGKSLKP